MIEEVVVRVAAVAKPVVCLKCASPTHQNLILSQSKFVKFSSQGLQPVFCLKSASLI